MRFEGVEFIVQLLQPGPNPEVISFVVHYHAAEAQVKAKMEQSFTWSKPKWNSMFAGAN